MSIVANPEALRALARSCSGASFDIRYNAKLFVDRSQGTTAWRGSAAQAFLQTTGHLHEDYRIVSVTLDDAAGVLHALAGQMDHVIHLRQQAQHLYQSIVHMRPETPDQHDYVNEQRWRAQDLQNQAEVLAQEADRRASQALGNLLSFQNRLTLPHLMSLGGKGAVAIDGLPTSWQDYYGRHGELFEDGSTPELDPTYTDAQRREYMHALAQVMVYNVYVPDTLKAGPDNDWTKRWIQEAMQDGYTYLFGNKSDEEIEQMVVGYFNAQRMDEEIDKLKLEGYDITAEPDYGDYLIHHMNGEDMLPGGGGGYIIGSVVGFKVKVPKNVKLPVGTAQFLAKLFKSKAGRVVRTTNTGMQYTSTTGINGELLSVFAKIEKQHLNTGSGTTQASRDMARQLGNPDDDAGHALGNVLGGPGGAMAGNIFPQSPNVNRGDFRVFESYVVKAVNAGKQVFVRVVPRYKAGSTRPYEILYQVRIDGKTITEVFPNP
ncbi:DNA/RNA non-specific endonuclease [Tumebacillus permanentifrigoris]|uniref:DNA/RNA non-specific endonuclease n=1 Tax=Tumebacillus permanentifrigoris TaxID=378543 RepID=A0A316DC26_9BACL|nr:DNA/RNA non-specific endonuclease [Tumebacillus permanentifrigoris]PWK14456.1 DNA/RNA non-specific endonuclease [Tumebacillus permanentifrigoris]